MRAVCAPKCLEKDARADFLCLHCYPNAVGDNTWAYYFLSLIKCTSPVKPRIINNLQIKIWLLSPEVPCEFSFVDVGHSKSKKAVDRTEASSSMFDQNIFNRYQLVFKNISPESECGFKSSRRQ